MSAKRWHCTLEKVRDFNKMELESPDFTGLKISRDRK